MGPAARLTGGVETALSGNTFAENQADSVYGDPNSIL